jgi:hypothetical protein
MKISAKRKCLDIARDVTNRGKNTVKRGTNLTGQYLQIPAL